MDTTATVFWPTDLTGEGYVYGWLKPCFCVVGILNSKSESAARKALLDALECAEYSAVAQYFRLKGEPTVLGYFDGGLTSEGNINFRIGSKVLRLNFVYYNRYTQKSMRFYSLGDFILDPIQKPHRNKHQEEAIKHDFTSHSPSISGIDAEVMHQLSASKTLESLVSCTSKELFGFSLRKTNRQSFKMLFQIFGLTSHLPRTLIQTLRLKDLSAVVQQFDVREEQAKFFITEFCTVRPSVGVDYTTFSTQYVNYYNTVWLVLNDVIIGIGLGTFLCENHQILGHLLEQAVKEALVGPVIWALTWLDSWPAGLKLNTELSQLYSHSFINLVTMWGDVLAKLAKGFPSLVFIVGILSYGGVTLAISLSSDLLGLLTAHIYVCYYISATVYYRQLKIAGSLWNLFRGKRFNVLRNRIDSWDYDMDQLLFGTMLFTLLAFLFSTILAYYSLFALLRLAIILLQASMETSLAFMNHFPLFALVLKLKDPLRLPGGVYFTVSPEFGSGQPPLTLKSEAIPILSIFHQYIQLWSRLSTHYNPLRLLYRVFSGQHLTPIPRYSIRYNKLSNQNNSAD